MDLHPNFPVVEGHYQMTREWSVSAPAPMNRRVQERALVLWRPGLTAWITVWGNNVVGAPQERLKWIKETASKEGYDRKESTKGPVVFYSYRLVEPAEDKRRPAFYCSAIGRTGHVQFSIYFDNEKDLAKAESLCHSARESVPGSVKE